MSRREAPGYRSTVLAVELRRPLSESDVQLPAAVMLSPKTSDTVRILFGGDVALGRRFLDVTGTTPRTEVPADHPDALIQVSDPEPGSQRVFERVRPYFQAADFRVVNLETPVTDTPVTPHPDKDYCFFTLPGSLPALTWLGVDYVSEGNNHVYDYLQAGLADTLEAVDAAGLGHSGAGLTRDAAFIPWRTRLGGSPYSFLSATSISGDSHADSYVATSTQGGAADLRDDLRMSRTLATERAAGRLPIALLHVGVEYSAVPGTYALERMQWVAGQGAVLVVAHHPHTPQGLSRFQGALIAQSLGNLAFDQDRVETMLGLLAEVELKGSTLERARLLPVYLEDYRPRPVTGELAERMLRRMADLSRAGGVELVPSASDAVVLPAGVHAATSERTLDLPIHLGPSGWAVLDLRGHRQPGESLASAQLSGSGAASGRLRAGRDVLEHGDFEDSDVDEQVDEMPRWDLGDTGASRVCHLAPHRGTAALCQVRAAGAASEAIAAFRNRIRAPGFVEGAPNKALTLVGWSRGRGAGRVHIQARYHASEGDAEFGGEEAWEHAPGTWDWEQLAADLHLPEDPPSATELNAPWALRLFVQSAAPGEGDGLVGTDDLAVVAWERTGEVGRPLALPTPHARDFLRVEGAAGDYTVRVTFRAHRLP